VVLLEVGDRVVERLAFVLADKIRAVQDEPVAEQIVLDGLCGDGLEAVRDVRLDRLAVDVGVFLADEFETEFDLCLRCRSSHVGRPVAPHEERSSALDRSRRPS